MENLTLDGKNIVDGQEIKHIDFVFNFFNFFLKKISGHIYPAIKELAIFLVFLMDKSINLEKGY